MNHCAQCGREAHALYSFDTGAGLIQVPLCARPTCHAEMVKELKVRLERAGIRDVVPRIT